eukprot:CAMPEP_0206486988 /NCGR_PEP_ID=MMETSP0324_2-20121206/41347_1 /ASSEMBLY_ACC=CAM_ASM_000836 /TAXON_ID=2866 /ORGANISM="Crypthecodinium cohnii, Strain Seligo" /LENGTH=294 /DNA_ID=CAMNT_0053965331 /DNA_START=87 /DNA_END=967 /DNA_ORIENTATION=-
MASFGRKKPLLGGSSKPGAVGTGKEVSDAYKKMMDEEKERERFAEEYKNKLENDAKASSKAAREAKSNAASAAETVKKANPHVYLEIEVKGPELLGRSTRVEASGRLEFELFANEVPKTAENFRCLCTGEKGKNLSFADSIFHRIIPGFMAQGGDITDGDGTGGRSIYGNKFADENFNRRHEERGMLSMANSGPNTNGSQFFILFKATPHLDRKHVVFGRLIAKGQSDSLLRKIEEKGTKSGDVKGLVKIIDAGELEPIPIESEDGDRTDARRSQRDRDGSRFRDRGGGRGGGG